MTLRLLLFVVTGVAVAVGLVTDLRWRKIPDLVTAPAALAALGLRFAYEGLGDAERGLISGSIGGGACLLLFGLFALGSGSAGKRGLGWGDVKLMAAAGAAFGYPLALTALIFVSLAGAAQAVGLLIWQGAVSDTLRAVVRRWRGGVQDPAPRTIPYGVAIALGSAWTMWWDSTRLGGT